MRFVTLAAAFLSGVSGLPAPESGVNTLSKRAAMCTTNNMEDLTTTTSASVADCLALSSSSLFPQSWTPTEANGYTLDLAHGSCGFRAQFLPANGSLNASQVEISAAFFGSDIEIAIERYAAEGKVGAAGKIICLAAGMVTKVGWVAFEIYHV
ncbi:hypothetical protein B0I37DRAFT_91403 [Chaetomium sp. MPI-CAGE-AT-0009]|nr:hypothetical protein B0I37DRAFT_91403 [Chaetomium sp. MPI-CAGE-AT-0009]